MVLKIGKRSRVYFTLTRNPYSCKHAGCSGSSKGPRQGLAHPCPSLQAPCDVRVLAFTHEQTVFSPNNCFRGKHRSLSHLSHPALGATVAFWSGLRPTKSWAERSLGGRNRCADNSSQVRVPGAGAWFPLLPGNALTVSHASVSPGIPEHSRLRPLHLGE